MDMKTSCSDEFTNKPDYRSDPILSYNKNQIFKKSENLSKK